MRKSGADDAMALTESLMPILDASPQAPLTAHDVSTAMMLNHPLNLEEAASSNDATSEEFNYARYGGADLECVHFMDAKNH
jgi:hypothetical protein